MFTSGVTTVEPPNTPTVITENKPSFDQSHMEDIDLTEKTTYVNKSLGQEIMSVTPQRNDLFNSFDYRLSESSVIITVKTDTHTFKSS